MASNAGNTTYPGNFQNVLQDTGDFFKDHALINHKAGYIEFVNSSGIEALNIFHKSGSGLSITNRQFGLLATKAFKGNFLSDVVLESKGHLTIHSDKDVQITCLGDQMEIVGNVDGNQKHVEKIGNILKEIHPKKQLFEIKRAKFYNELDQSPLQTKSGSLAKCPIEKIEIKIVKTDSPMVWQAGTYAPCSRVLPKLTDNEDSFEKYKGGGGICRDDGFYDISNMGTGESPSSQDGKWSVESLKDQIEQDMINNTDQLADEEKFLGSNKKPSSGQSMTKYAGNRTEVIGLGFNTLSPIRLDRVGRLIPNNVTIDPLGSSVYKSFRAGALIERVHTDSLPGGNLVVNVGNSYNLNVGSNGIDIKTSGSFDLFGSTMRILSQQIQMNTRWNMELTSGDTMLISSPNIVIKPLVVELQVEDSSGNIRTLPANGKNKTEQLGQLLIDGNLGVVGNTIIKGGMHVDGEITGQHITIPGEYHITEEDFEYGSSTNCSSNVLPEDACAEDLIKGPTYADIVDGCLIGYAIVGSGSSAGSWPVISVCAPSSVLVHPHHHMFKNAAMRLIMENQDVDVTYGDTNKVKNVNPHDLSRAIGSRNNSVKPVLAKPVKNSKTNYTVQNKFGNSNCGKPVTIQNSDWEETCELDSLPEGSGIDMKSTQDSVLNQKLIDNNQEGINKALAFSEKLGKVSEERKNHETFYQP